MKPTELMIGDWYYLEDEGKKYPLQVTKETFALADEDIANFQPIPLTAEILEKIGFILDSNNIFYLRENIKYGLIKDYYCGYWYANRADIYKEYVCSCDYIHELQHILKISGIKKDIVL